MDLEERTGGELLNNRRTFSYQTNTERKAEEVELKRYHGGIAIDNSDRWLFARFDEVWTETIAIRKVFEALGRDQTEIQKGMDLMHAISIGDPSIMQKTGIFSVISPPQR